MKLECSMLFVKDFARMREFYGEALQSRPVNTEAIDSWALFDVGGTGFALHAIPAEHLKEGANGANSPRETVPVKLIFAVEDVAAERSRLEALGATMLPRPWQRTGESCDFADPEGNVFQIAASERLPRLLGRS